MKSNSQIRKISRQNLEFKWGISAFVALVFILGQSVVSLGFICYFLLPMTYGMCAIYLGVARGKYPDVKGLYTPYTDIRVWVLMGVKMLYLFLWTLLLIIPGIIKFYSYSMAEYLLMDDPRCTVYEAMEQSKRMMSGYKWKLFCLDLSFAGWYLLSVLTLGVGFFFLCPYWYTARANFYLALKHNSAFRDLLDRLEEQRTNPTVQPAPKEEEDEKKSLTGHYDKSER